VDGIIRAKSFDDSLHIFVRRILEDAHQATINPDIVSAHLHLLNYNSIVGGANSSSTSPEAQKPKILDISQMRDKRPQILTMLKATASENGLIELQFYLRVDRSLPVFETAHTSSSSGTNSSFVAFRKPTSGYIQVKITYRLTYQDDSDPTRTKICTHLPLQTLATSVFMSLEDAQRYLQAYLWYNAAQNAKRKGNNSTNSSRVGSEYAILVSSQARVVCRFLRQQELLEMCESLLLLQILLQGDHFRATNATGNETNEKERAANNSGANSDDREAYFQAMEALSYPIVQLTVALKSSAAHLRAIRDAFHSALAVLRLLEIAVLEHPILHMHFQGLLGSNSGLQEEQDGTSGFFYQLANLHKIVDELRHLIQELCFQSNGQSNTFKSHLHYMRHWLMSRMLSLYDAINPSQPLLPADRSMWQRMDQIHVLLFLRQTHQVLTSVESTLKHLEVNILMENLGIMIGQDVASYSLYQQTLVLEARALASTGQWKLEFQKVKFPLLENDRDYRDVPRCFLDCISYALYQAQYRDQQTSYDYDDEIEGNTKEGNKKLKGKNSSSDNSKRKSFGWRVLQLHPSIREENDCIVPNILGNAYSNNKTTTKNNLGSVFETKGGRRRNNPSGSNVYEVDEKFAGTASGDEDEDNEAVQRAMLSDESNQLEWFRLWRSSSQRPSSVAMVWDYFGYIGMYNYSKYGGIMKRALQWNEAYHRDVPRSIIAEASLIRYLTESQLLGMISRSIFHMISAPSVSGTAKAANSTQVFFSHFLPQLFESSEALRTQLQPLAKYMMTTEELADQIFHPVRYNQLKPMLKTSDISTTSLVKYDGPFRLNLSRIPMHFRPHLPRMLEGGILGTERALSGLGARSEDLLGLVWSLPSLLPQPLMAMMPMKTSSTPLSSNLKLQLMMGITLSSALNFTKKTSKPAPLTSSSAVEKNNNSIKDQPAKSSKFFSLKFPGFASSATDATVPTKSARMDAAEPEGKDRCYFDDVFSTPLEMELIVHTSANEGPSGMGNATFPNRRQSMAGSQPSPFTAQQYESQARKKFAESILVLVDQWLSSSPQSAQDGHWQFLSASVSGMTTVGTSDTKSKNFSLALWNGENDLSSLPANKIYGHHTWQYSAKDLNKNYVDDFDLYGDYDFVSGGGANDLDFSGGESTRFGASSHQEHSHLEQLQLQMRRRFLWQVAQAGEVVIDTMVLCPSAPCMLSAEDVYDAFAEVTGVAAKIREISKVKKSQESQATSPNRKNAKKNNNKRSANQTPDEYVPILQMETDLAEDEEQEKQLVPSPSADRMAKRFLRRATVMATGSLVDGTGRKSVLVSTQRSMVSESTETTREVQADIVVEDVEDDEINPSQQEMDLLSSDDSSSDLGDDDEESDEDMPNRSKIEENSGNLLQALHFLHNESSNDLYPYLQVDEADFQQRAKIDPTFSDSTRLFGSLRDPSSLLQKRLTQKLQEKFQLYLQRPQPTSFEGNSSSSSISFQKMQWLPVRLHVTCLLQQHPQFVTSRAISGRPQTVAKFLHSNVHPSVSLSSMSRLLTRTVYFSSTTMQTLWQCLAPQQIPQSVTNPAETEDGFLPQNPVAASVSRGKSLAIATALQVMSLRRSIEHMHFRAGGHQHSFRGHAHGQDVVSLGRMCIDYYLLTQQVHPCEHFLHVYRKAYDSYVNELYHVQTLLCGIAEQWTAIASIHHHPSGSPSLAAYMTTVHSCHAILEGIFRSPYCPSVTVHLRGLAAVLLSQFQRLFEQWYAPSTFASTASKASEEGNKEASKSTNAAGKKGSTGSRPRPIPTYNQQLEFDEAALTSSASSSAPTGMVGRSIHVPPAIAGSFSDQQLHIQDIATDHDEYQFVYEDGGKQLFNRQKSKSSSSADEAVRTAEQVVATLSSPIGTRMRVLLQLLRATREQGGHISDVAISRVSLSGQLLTEIAHSVATMVHVVAQDCYAEFLHPSASTVDESLDRLLHPSDFLQQEREASGNEVVIAMALKKKLKKSMGHFAEYSNTLLRAFRSSVEAFPGYFGNDHFETSQPEHNRSPDDDSGDEDKRQEEFHAKVIFPAIVAFAQRAQYSDCHRWLLRPQFHVKFLPKNFHWQGLVHESLDGLETIHTPFSLTHQQQLDSDDDDDFGDMDPTSQHPHNGDAVHAILDQSLQMAQSKQQKLMSPASSSASLPTAKSRSNESSASDLKHGTSGAAAAAKMHLQMIHKVFKAMQPAPVVAEKQFSLADVNTKQPPDENEPSNKQTESMTEPSNTDPDDQEGEGDDPQLRKKKSVSWLLSKLKKAKSSSESLASAEGSKDVTDDHSHNAEDGNQPSVIEKEEGNEEEEKESGSKKNGSKWNLAATVRHAQQAQHIGQGWLQKQRSHSKLQAQKVQHFATMLQDSTPKPFLHSFPDVASDGHNNSSSSSGAMNADIQRLLPSSALFPVDQTRFLVDSKVRAAAASFAHSSLPGDVDVLRGLAMVNGKQEAAPPVDPRPSHPPSMLQFLRAYHAGHIHDPPTYTANSSRQPFSAPPASSSLFPLVPTTRNTSVPLSSESLLAFQPQSRAEVPARARVDPFDLLNHVSSSTSVQDALPHADVSALSPLSQFRHFAQQQQQQDQRSLLSALLPLHDTRHQHHQQQLHQPQSQHPYHHQQHPQYYSEPPARLTFAFAVQSQQQQQQQHTGGLVLYPTSPSQLTAAAIMRHDRQHQTLQRDEGSIEHLLQQGYQSGATERFTESTPPYPNMSPVKKNLFASNKNDSLIRVAINNASFQNTAAQRGHNRNGEGDDLVAYLNSSS
jgi:hypothetical protein